MTTSLSKSTIPEYDPYNSYVDPAPKPKVTREGYENYQRNQGTLNLGDWAIEGRQWESPRPLPKVKFEEAEENLKKNQGCMKDLLTGYLDNPLPKKGPRVKKEALDNFNRNKGSVASFCFKDYGKVPEYTRAPDTYRKGAGHDSVNNLFVNYGHLPLSARPAPRVKFEGTDNREQSLGDNASKTLHQIPPTERPKTAASNIDFLW